MLATALRRRAPGMTLMRMPVFTWSMLVTCLLIVFAFPALILALALLWAQRHFGGVLTGGLGAVDYQQLFWFYGHPVVYVMFFPFRREWSARSSRRSRVGGSSATARSCSRCSRSRACR